RSIHSQPLCRLPFIQAGTHRNIVCTLGEERSVATRRKGIRLLVGALLLVAGVLAIPLHRRPAAAEAARPTGFPEQVGFSGLDHPTDVEFSPDGRVFVAQKNGVIKVFDSLTDQTPDVFADLSTNVHDSWDRGLLGMALAPNFPTDPYVYVLYTYDAPIGGQAPVFNDVCPGDPP